MAMATRQRSAIDPILWSGSGALLLAVTVLSLTPQPPPGGFTLPDKLEHVLAYASLSGCALLAAVWRPGRGDGPFPRSAGALALAILGLGIALELAQAFGPFSGRTGDPLDALADAIGIAAALAAWHTLRRRAALSVGQAA